MESEVETTWGKARTGLAPALAALCMLVFPSQGAAQSFDLKGGTSSLINASGFAANYKWFPVEGWVGLAATPEIRMGAALRTEYRGYDLSIGDQFFPFVLETDVFEQYQYFDARGLSLSRKTDKQNWTVFTGTTAEDFSTSFARSFASSGLTGAVFYNRKLNSRLSFSSRNIFRRDITSIHSVGFQVTPDWKIGAAGGIGANTPYASLATQYQYKWFDATAAYISNGESFQRVRARGPIIAERTGPNLRLRFTPVTGFRVQLDSQQILVPSLAPRPPLRASLDSISLAASLRKFSLGGSFTESRSGSRETRGQTISAGRSLGSRINLNGSAIHVASRGGLSQSAFIATVREKISPRISLRQTVNFSGGRTTMGYGAQFLSNRITLGANYQTIYNPLALGPEGRHIYQAWMFNIGIALPRGIRIHYNNFVDAFGRVRYTAYASGIGYSREVSYGNLSSPTTRVRFHENIVKGSVKDETGRPVWGIAVKIGNDTVFSDKSGKFFLRVKDPKEYPIAVSLEKAINPAIWEVVSAPQTAVAQLPKSAEEVTIIVRRLVTLQRRSQVDGEPPATSAALQP